MPRLGVCKYIYRLGNHRDKYQNHARFNLGMEELKTMRAVFTQTEFERKDTLSRVREIEKMLRARTC